MVADIGGGTSDFSLVRLSPERAKSSTARLTSWPTAASISAGPTSTAP